MAIAAPEAILSGADLLAIAGICLVIGFLYAGKGIIAIMFAPFEISLPFGIGRPFGGIVDVIEGTLNAWIDKWIAANQAALADLLNGLVWLVHQTAHAIEETAHYSELAFDHIVNVVTPGQIETAIKDATSLAHGAATSVAALEHAVSADVTALEGKIAHAISSAETYAETKVSDAEKYVLGAIPLAVQTVTHDLTAIIDGVDTTLSRRITAIEGSLEDKVNAAVAAAIAVLKPGIASGVQAATAVGGATETWVQGAISAAIAAAIAGGGSIEQAITNAVNAAHGAVVSAGGTVTGDINGQIAASIAAGLAAGGAIDNDIRSIVAGAIADIPITGGITIPGIEDITKPIRDILTGITDVTLPQLAALTAGIGATLTLVMTEAGLNDPECRAKNKGICSVPSTNWGSLISGLIGLGVALDFNDLVSLCEDGFGAGETFVETLTGS